MVAADTLRFTFRAKWGKAKSITPALAAVRQRVIADIAQEIRESAPDAFRDRVRETPKGVVIDSRGAVFVEYGSGPHYPSPRDLAAWVASKGKDDRAAFRIAQSIAKRGTRARPFMRPAIVRALARADATMTATWRTAMVGRLG